MTSLRFEVWLLKGPKAGDYTQIRSLAAALGFHTQTRSLVFRGTELLQHLWPRPTLAGLDPSRSDRLEPPWPDLVLTAGRRNELVARWVKDQSGGRTRIVHIGRPWSRPEAFDLVIATPQYTLREGGHVLVNDLPLHDVNARTLAAASTEWANELGQMPHPRLALLVGGDSGPFVFDATLAERMASEVNLFLRRSKAKLWFSASGRTPAAFLDRLLPALDTPAHRWVPRAGAALPNPYRGYLALADGFIVTSESVSMIAEAVATGKPVWLFDVAGTSTTGWRLSSLKWKPLTHRLAQVLAPARFRRDVGLIHGRLIRSGRVSWLDGSAVFETRTRIDAAQNVPDADMERSTAAVRRLLGA